MNDLISRQAALDEFDGVKFDEAYCTEYEVGYNDGIDFAVSRLSVLPSAQPEIIRCKDCKYNPKKSWFGCPMPHLREEQLETAWCWNWTRKDDE